jgi:gas vesicle structural protein
MAIERAGGTSLIDVLDRVLDKGIVIDATVRLSLVGFEIITVEARVVVASINTFLDYAVAVGQIPSINRPLVTAGSEQVPTELLTEGARKPAAAGSRVAAR